MQHNSHTFLIRLRCSNWYFWSFSCRLDSWFGCMCWHNGRWPYAKRHFRRAEKKSDNRFVCSISLKRNRLCIVLSKRICTCKCQSWIFYFLLFRSDVCLNQCANLVLKENSLANGFLVRNNSSSNMQYRQVTTTLFTSNWSFMCKRRISTHT